VRLNSQFLYEICEPVLFDKPHDNLRLVHKLLRVMKAQGGIGLAANQAGHKLKLFVMCVDHEYFHCFNPKIIHKSHRFEYGTEGCLSFPDQRLMVPRAAEITAEWQTAYGHVQTRKFTGLAARCFQHELDHLSGVTMFHRAMTHSATGDLEFESAQ